MSIPEEETTIEPEEPREKESVRMMILRVIHNAWMAWGFTFFFCLVTSERTPQNIALTFLLPAYALLCDYLQKKSRNFFLFFGLLAGGWIGIGFAIPDTFLRIDALIIAFMAMFFTFFARFSEQYIFYPRGGFLASGIIMFILGALTERPAASRFAFVYEVVLSVLILLCRSEESLEDAVAQVPKGGIIPMDTIRAQYRRNLAKWLIGGAGCLVLLWIFRSGDFIANAIEQSVRFLLLWIIRFINWIISLFPVPDMEQMQQFDTGSFEPGAAGTANPILQIFFQILEYAAFVIFAAIAAFLVYRIFLALYRNFRGARIRGTDTFEYYKPEQKKEKAAAGTRDTVSFFDRSAEASVRRRYIRLVREGTRFDAVEKSDTPHEIERKTIADGQTGEALETEEPGDTERSPAERIHRIYEKARYDRKATAEDLAAMRESEKELKKKTPHGDTRK